MFGRLPKLPIDLIYPQVNQPKFVSQEEITQIPGLDCLAEEHTTLKPQVAENIAALKVHLEYIGTALSQNRDIVMDKAKAKHDRRIKRASYNVGDWVLCSHPKIAKGMKRGIAFKYYGPFKVLAADANGCNYTIKMEGKKTRRKNVHKNNLKFFFKREIALQPDKNLANKEGNNTNSQTETRRQVTQRNHNRATSESSEEEPALKTRKTYTKDPSNPRWKKHLRTGKHRPLRKPRQLRRVSLKSSSSESSLCTYQEVNRNSAKSQKTNQTSILSPIAPQISGNKDNTEEYDTVEEIKKLIYSCMKSNTNDQIRSNKTKA